MQRKKLKKQKRILIITTCTLLLFLTIGYAAFSTTISLNAKGNIKEIYQIVTFKNQLLNNTNFENNAEGWIKIGCSTTGFETDNINNQNAIRIYENGGGQGCWNGVRQIIDGTGRSFDKTKTYEISADFYRDENSEYGDLLNTIRFYVTLGGEDKSNEVWLRINENNSSSIDINNLNLPNKTWLNFTGTSNSPTNNAFENDTIWYFNIDYNGSNVREDISNVWVSNPSFYEVETKNIRKYNKIGELPVPVKAGYTFLGWFTEENGEKITEDTIITEDATYYARFTKDI